MNLIHLNGLRFFARHGVMPQERVVGAMFTVNVTISTDFMLAAREDRLDGTISYADAYRVIREETLVPSQLLENVAWRIAVRLLRDFPAAEEVTVSLFKHNPPIGGADCREAGVTISLSQQNK